MKKDDKKEVVKTEITHSPAQRFLHASLKYYGENPGQIELTGFQKKLIQNYFVKFDLQLKAYEAKRMQKREDQRETLPYTWNSINMEKLAQDVVPFACVGLDPLQKNHINIIPFQNKTSNKYDVTFIVGYRGLELRAAKYGLNMPDCVTVELVYSKDKFVPIKKSASNPVENYEFDLSDDPFDRGEIIGGFFYHSYKNSPEKNMLRLLSIKDIEKRKPKYASTEFWGGEKDKWEGGKKVGKEQIDGWRDEMCLKTVYRMAYEAITIDSEKIDDHLVQMIEIEKKDFDFVEDAFSEEVFEEKKIEVIEEKKKDLKEKQSGEQGKMEMP